VGVGATAPRGPLDVAGAGDSYLLTDPAVSNGQSTYLPGHLYLAPYSFTDPTAYVQARVPNPNAGTNLGLVLRTTSAGTLVNALALGPGGNLNTAGSVSTQGDVTVPAASGYKYAGPKTYTYTVGAADFSPEYSGAQYLIHRNGDTDELFASTGLVEAAFRAPLHLPQGAVIRRLTINFQDSEPDYDLTAAIRKLSVAAPQAAQTLLVGISPGGTPGYATDFVGLNEVVDDDTNHYFLQVTFGAGNSLLTLSTMRVTYTVTQAD
jgi:hypothetical protein